eukprot:9468629-Pyramimonas_sp.AAC.1
MEKFNREEGEDVEKVGGAGSGEDERGGERRGRASMRSLRGQARLSISSLWPLKLGRQVLQGLHDGLALLEEPDAVRLLLGALRMRTCRAAASLASPSPFGKLIIR